MNGKERLIELLTDSMDKQYEKRRLITPQHTADDLLANGVIVPPCKVRDVVYKVSFVHKNVTPLQVEGFIRNLASWRVHCTHLIPSWIGNQKEHIYISFSSFGKTAFLTKEEAERVLEENNK